MKKRSQKLQCFFSIANQKPAQISDIFHTNLPLRDFSIMTLALTAALHF